MKRLLSVVAIAVLAATLAPPKAHALLRGGFEFVTGTGADPFVRPKFAPVLRGGVTTGSGTAASPRRERWLTFVVLSQVVGSESVGELHQVRNIDQSYLRGNPDEPLLADPTGAVSYIDPAWSKDGKWLAYVQTDNNVSSASIWVQQFNTSTAAGNQALGAPILIADGTGNVHHRHPAFNSTATQIAYDSDAAGSSIDLWSVDISLNATAHTGTVNEASRVRHEGGIDLNTLNSKAEFKPAYSPDNTKLAYVSNRFGAFQLYIVTLSADGLNESTVGAELNPALVTHDNPSWSSNGLSIYYDAPSAEDPSNPQDIWKIDLATGQKCNMFIDLAGDVDPNVSQYTNATRDGVSYNFFCFISQAAALGVQVWFGQYIQSCVPALPVQVQVSPNNVDLNVAVVTGDLYKITTSFPASLISQGYVCRALNTGGEGIRMRNSIIASPTIMGLRVPGYPIDPTKDCTSMVNEIFGGPGAASGTDSVNCESAFNDFLASTQYGWWDMKYDTTGGGTGLNHQMIVNFPRRNINNRIVALNLVNKYVPVTYRSYTNVTGRQLLGFAYIQLARTNYAAGSIAMRQNYPNPFNPVTKIAFANDKAGKVDVRVFNVRGELVRTVTDTWYPQGEHTVSWDGRTTNGSRASSGVYYVRARTGSSTDVIKAVLAK